MGLLTVPLVDQFVTIERTGESNAFADSDCGEACAAMELFFRDLPVPSLTEIRRDIPGHETYGQTDGLELAAFLRSKGLGSHVEQPPVGRMETRVKLAIDRGNPPILLGGYVDPTILHWIVVTGHRNGQAFFNNPFHGKKEQQPWTWVCSRYGGEVVLVYPR